MRALLAVMTPVRYYSKSAHELAAAMVELAPAERNSSFLERTAAERKEAKPSMMGYAQQMTAFWTFSSVRWLHRIEKPALVLAGAEDKLVPAANAALLAAYLPNARFRLYDQWGHYVLHDARSGAGAAVSDFFGAERPEDSAAWHDAQAITGENLASFVRPAPTVHPAAIVSRLVRHAFPPPRRGGPG
jgi:pimeloyl-ACP methyl ester carboxylesterase